MVTAPDPMTDGGNLTTGRYPDTLAPNPPPSTHGTAPEVEPADVRADWRSCIVVRGGFPVCGDALLLAVSKTNSSELKSAGDITDTSSADGVAHSDKTASDSTHLHSAASAVRAVLAGFGPPSYAANVIDVTLVCPVERPREQLDRYQVRRA
jgi:hypothetical protein